MEWTSAVNELTNNVMIEMLTSDGTVTNPVKAYVLSVTFATKKYSLCLKADELKWLCDIFKSEASKGGLSLYKGRTLDCVFLDKVVLLTLTDESKPYHASRKLYLDVALRSQIATTVQHFMKTVSFPFVNFSSHDIFWTVQHLNSLRDVKMQGDVTLLLLKALRMPFPIEKPQPRNDESIALLKQPLYELVSLLVKQIPKVNTKF